MRNIILTSIMLFYSYVFGGNPYRDVDMKVADIDNQILYKAYVAYSNRLGEYVLLAHIDTVTNSDYYEAEVDFVYFDNKGRIRKLITYSEYTSFISRIGYYDEGGDLMYSISYDSGEGIVGYSSNTYLNKGEILLKKGKVFVDLIDKPFYFTFQYDTLYPAEAEYFPYEYLSDMMLEDKSICHVNKIEKWGFSKINMPNNCDRIKFSKADAGDATIVNAYDVNIRKGPGKKEQIIDIIEEQGHPIVVLEKLFEERVNSIETYPWYKITYNCYRKNTFGNIGYIYGKYLDPVEKTIE